MKYQKDVFERFKRPWTFTAKKKDLFNKLLNQGSSLLATTSIPYHQTIIKLMASFNTWSSKWCISTNYLFLTATNFEEAACRKEVRNWIERLLLQTMSWLLNHWPLLWYEAQNVIPAIRRILPKYSLMKVLPLLT